MAMSSEACALLARINRALSAIPVMKQRSDLVAKMPTRTRRKRASMPPGITQLSLFSDLQGNNDQAQAG